MHRRIKRNLIITELWKKMEKNGILLLESENRSLKDDPANKQRFIENLLNLDESNILSHIKKINTGSNNNT